MALIAEIGEDWTTPVDTRMKASHSGIQYTTEAETLDQDDTNGLKNCEPGKCELQLPAESIEKSKTSINWSEPDVPAQVNSLAQKMALDELVKYQKDGNSALGSYYDKEHPLHVVEQFEPLLREPPSFAHYLPDLQQYLIP